MAVKCAVTARARVSVCFNGNRGGHFEYVEFWWIRCMFEALGVDFVCLSEGSRAGC